MHITNFHRTLYRNVQRKGQWCTFQFSARTPIPSHIENIHHMEVTVIRYERMKRKLHWYDIFSIYLEANSRV